MRYGISAGAIIVQDQRVLLVRHYRENKFDFWLPPGGGLKGEESIFDCARRETSEETGLDVTPERIVYVQEFIEEPDYHFCKFFILCHAHNPNEVTIEHKEDGEEHLVDARYWSEAEISAVSAHPEILHDVFWTDMKAGFPEVRYLGLQRYREE